MQTIHDEYQALLLAYNELEKRQKELESDNLVLRQELTKQVENLCKPMDEEILKHEQ